MTLYEIRDELQKALESLEVNEDGEIVNIDAYETIKGEFEEKAEAVACYIKGLVAEAEALEKEKEASIERFDSRIESLEKQAESYRQYLWKNIEATGLSKFETGKCKVTHRVTDQVIVDDEFAIPETFFKVTQPKPIKKPDKAAIKEYIKNGGAVSGAHLQTNNNVTVK